MKYYVKATSEEPTVLLSDKIPYGYRRFWNQLAVQPLYLSLIRPYKPEDSAPGKPLPLIIWICGGAFAEMDRNVWLPELAWFAKQGFAVASLDYSVACTTKFPDNINNIKQGITWLRNHSDTLGLDPSRFAIMGESAGGYLAALAALTNGLDEFSPSENSQVQAAVVWYPPTQIKRFVDNVGPEFDKTIFPGDINNYPDLLGYINSETLPDFLLLHGTQDTIVDISHSENLYNAITKTGKDAEFHVLEGAKHGDTAFIQTPIKQTVLSFLNKVFLR